MQSLWPTPPRSEPDLERIYGYPEELTRPWVQLNFVSSADGAATVENHTEQLSHPADQRIFQLGRDLADVVLVGAGTVRAEGYRGLRATGERAARRARLGRSAVPPIAVVSGSALIAPDSALLTDTLVPPIVFTTERAPRERKRALAGAGAEIVIAGDEDVDLRLMMDEFTRRGLLRVDCEGGPRLFTGLLAADLVDQLCLTIAPMLTGPGAPRIVDGLPIPRPRRLDLASVLVEDGYTMLRYRGHTG